MLRLKQEGLLAGVIHTHFLQNLEHDECPAFLICRLLLFCLHTEPKRRFNSMTDILSILHYADTSATYSHPPASTPLFESFYCFTKNQFQNMQNLAMGSFSATPALDGMPDAETRQLRDLRARREMEYWCKSHSDWKDLQAFCISITTAIRTLCGLMPNMDSFGSVLSVFASISSIDATQAPLVVSQNRVFAAPILDQDYSRPRSPWWLFQTDTRHGKGKDCFGSRRSSVFNTVTRF